MKYELLEAMIEPDGRGNDYFDRVYDKAVAAGGGHEKIRARCELIAGGEFKVHDQRDRADYYGRNPFWYC